MEWDRVSNSNGSNYSLNTKKKDSEMSSVTKSHQVLCNEKVIKTKDKIYF